MKDYILKIAGKRQVTLPKEIIQDLNLRKGDELQIIVHNPSHIQMIPYTRVRKDLITPEIEQILGEQRKKIESGERMIPMDEVLKKAARKNAKRSLAHAGPSLKSAQRAETRLAAG